MNPVALAFGATGGGVSALVLAAATGDTSTAASDLAPFLSGGGAVTAVGGLVYMARKIINGELVPRNVREHEVELNAAIAAAGQRESRVMQLVEDVRGDHREVAATLREVQRVLEDVRSSVRRRREDYEP